MSVYRNISASCLNTYVLFEGWMNTKERAYKSRVFWLYFIARQKGFKEILITKEKENETVYYNFLLVGNQKNIGYRADDNVVDWRVFVLDGVGKNSTPFSLWLTIGRSARSSSSFLLLLRVLWRDLCDKRVFFVLLLPSFRNFCLLRAFIDVNLSS